ncbi:MAG: GNAT family N-acetyltransferase, partial [Cyanobacteria bacterium P01_D01_bin.115]
LVGDLYGIGSRGEVVQVLGGGGKTARTRPRVVVRGGPAGAETIDETLAFITDSLAKMRRRTDLVLAIARREGEFLGCCGLHITQSHRTPELGIWLKKSAHGNGYGKEAIELLTTWAVANLEFEYAIYPVDKANIPSRKIPAALGGFVISEQKVEAMTGHILDEVVYKIPYEILRARHNSRA